MKDTRANRIAANFFASPYFSVHPFHQGLLVYCHHQICYFVRESCFWAFIYQAAGFDERDENASGQASVCEQALFLAPHPRREAGNKYPRRFTNRPASDS